MGNAPPEGARRPARSQTFDWPGSITFTVGLGATLLALSLFAFPLLRLSIIYVILGCGVAGRILFFAVEVKAPQPMLDLGLFRHRLFSFASLANALNGLARGAVLFVLIFFLQGPYGKDPLQAGITAARLELRQGQTVVLHDRAKIELRLPVGVALPKEPVAPREQRPPLHFGTDSKTAQVPDRSNGAVHPHRANRTVTNRYHPAG